MSATSNEQAHCENVPEPGPQQELVSPWRRAVWLSVHVLGGWFFFLLGAWASLVMHVAALALLSLWPMLLDSSPRGVVYQVEFHEPLPEPEQPEPEPIFHLQPDDTPQEQLLAAQTMAVAQDSVAQPQQVVFHRVLENVQTLQVHAPPTKEQLGLLEHDLLRRSGAAGVDQVNVQGAVDRITQEVALQLEKRNVLLVWLMDRSLSMEDQRQQVAQRMQRVYAELDQLGLLGGRRLLAAVVGFGQQPVMVVEPTEDVQQVTEAILQVPPDESGVENVFATVAACAGRFAPYVRRGRRKLMLVVWTDESGQDVTLVEQAVALCQRVGAQVLVVGPSAMLGQRVGKHPYRHPEDGKLYWLPVDRGPDSLYPERIRLPFWFDGPQYESLAAGVPPYALGRLVSGTGGIYLIHDPEQARSPFPLEYMIDYLPDYDSPAQYQRKVQSSRLRQAVLWAVQVTRKQRFAGQPPMEFAPNENNYAQMLLQAQKITAQNAAVLEEALRPFLAVKDWTPHYRKERSRRWRAWFDLTYGRLLAMKVRNDEYNWACAELKGRGREFVKEKSNRWRFVPDEKLRLGSASARHAKLAQHLLRRCVEEHPHTPWALLAQRELQYPLGFRIEERYVPPPPPPPKPKAQARRPPKPPPKPKIRPPDRRIRREQPRKLPRPQRPKLPKL